MKCLEGPNSAIRNGKRRGAGHSAISEQRADHGAAARARRIASGKTFSRNKLAFGAAAAVLLALFAGHYRHEYGPVVGLAGTSRRGKRTSSGPDPGRPQRTVAQAMKDMLADVRPCF